MAEEEKKVEEAPNVPPTATEADMARAIKEQADKIVKLTEENKQLLKAKKEYYDKVINGQEPNEAPKDEKTIVQCRKELLDAMQKGCSNLEYAKKVVELNKACIRETGQSCFLPKGQKVKISQDEVLTAKNFNDVLEDCISKAHDDPTAFNIVFQSYIRNN